MNDPQIIPPQWLPDLMDVNGAPAEIFRRLYAQFRLDFLDAPCYFQNAVVRCDRRKNPGEEYEEIFWHLVSRTDHTTQQRLLDSRRAEKLAWCAAVISDHDDPAVTVWDYVEGTGKTRTYFWLRDWDYVVILEKRKNTYWLITAFHVDASKRSDLEGRYRRRT